MSERTAFHLPGASLSTKGGGAFTTILETYRLAEKEPALLRLGSTVEAADHLHSVRELSSSDDAAALERSRAIFDAFLAALKARAARTGQV